jgi:hypothetical protein
MCRGDQPCTVFITSTTFQGNLGGLAGADAICAQAALNGSLPGTFKAWLSASNDSPVTRFTRSTGPYQLRNGATIAVDFDALVDGSIDTPINVSASGSVVATTFVWTETTAFGNLIDTNPAYNCLDWTSNNPDQVLVTVYTGSSDRLDGAWTDNEERYCDELSALYCFEQP